MKKIILFLPFILLFSTGFIRDVPTNVEKVNLKLTDNEIAITFLGLSSGEATLIHSQTGNILINTGGPGTKNELKKLMKMYDITELSKIILTNNGPEYKHNIEWLIKNYHVSELITGNSLAYLLKPYHYSKTKIWKKGDSEEILPNLFVHVLNENKDHHGKKGLDFSLKYGNHQILYMSSADENVEKELAHQDLSDINILKVADFALEEGTTQAFLDRVDPQVAVIFNKRGQIPNKDIIKRLHLTWIDIYQTSQYGNISIKLSPENYEVIPISIDHHSNPS